MWILLSRPWGALSDRRGRRTVLLAKVGGFMLAYRVMRILLIVSLRAPSAAGQVFAGLRVSRGAVGAFFAAIPAEGRAPVADHVAPGERAGAMTSLCAVDGVGLSRGRRSPPRRPGRWGSLPSIGCGWSLNRPPKPLGFAGCRAQSSTQSARRCLGRLANAPWAFLAHRSPKRGTGASHFALGCQTAFFVFGAKPRQGEKAKKKNPLAQRILFFPFRGGAAQAGPPDRSLPEAGRPAPPGGGYFKTAMKLSAMRSTLRLFKPATHMRPLLTM